MTTRPSNEMIVSDLVERLIRAAFSVVNRSLLFAAATSVGVACAQSPPRQPFDSVNWRASMTKPPVTGFALGGFSVQFERTKLNGVKRAVSLGRVDQQGDAAEHALWLCYTLGAPHAWERIWIISDGEMGGDTHVVTGVTAVRTPNSAPTRDCPELPSATRPVHFDTAVWLDSTTSQVDTALGRPSHIAGAWSAYDFQTTIPGDGKCEGGYDRLNWLFIKSERGVVSSIRAGQVTSC
jgi:hypothetical protein